MQNVNRQLKDIFSRYAADFDRAAERSRIEEIKNIQGGAVVPVSGKIYGHDARAAFGDVCAGYRDQIRGIMEGERKKIREKITDAPSADAVSAVSLLNMRKDIPENEFRNLLERYGNNYQVYQALASVARENGIHIEDHPLRAQLDGIDRLENSLCREIDIASAEKGHTSGAFQSIVGMTIDSVFPDGE